MTEIKILGFDPLQLELPSEDPIPAGTLRIELPPVRMLVARGWAMLPDASISSQVDGWHYAVDLAEPMPLAKAVEFVHRTQDTFRQLHAEIETVTTGKPLMSFDDAMRSGVVALAMANSWGDL